MVKWAYILIGDSKTGKTVFQKELIQSVALVDKDARLKSNSVFDVKTRVGNNHTRTISCMNRSFQEKPGEYKTVQDFFQSHFKEADACVLASHLHQENIEEMIEELKKRFYNVCGVFFEKSVKASRQANESIALLSWDEKYWITNPPLDPANNKNRQDAIRNEVIEFGNHLLCKNRGVTQSTPPPGF